MDSPANSISPLQSPLRARTTRSRVRRKKATDSVSTSTPLTLTPLTLGASESDLNVSKPFSFSWGGAMNPGHSTYSRAGSDELSRYMEDTYDYFEYEPLGVVVWTLLDGHGGHVTHNGKALFRDGTLPAWIYVRDTFRSTVLSQLSIVHECGGKLTAVSAVEKIINEAVCQVEKSLLTLKGIGKKAVDFTGTTFVVIAMVKGLNSIVVGNVGDSEAMIFGLTPETPLDAKVLTECHNVESNADERSRIVAEIEQLGHGDGDGDAADVPVRLTEDRIEIGNGMSKYGLAVSRSIGDGHMKAYEPEKGKLLPINVVSSKLYTRVLKIDELRDLESKTKAQSHVIVAGSDGLFSLGYGEIVKVVADVLRTEGNIDINNAPSNGNGNGECDTNAVASDPGSAACEEAAVQVIGKALDKVNVLLTSEDENVKESGHNLADNLSCIVIKLSV